MTENELAPGIADEEVEALLSHFQRDSKAAIAELLADCRHLRMQLLIAERTISPGYTRGWKPDPER